MYEKIARFYDLSHDALTADIPFILQLAGEGKGPVLELGCGTGRLLLPLLQAGHTVVGVDNSAAMLARAEARLTALPEAARARLFVQQQGMEALRLPPEVPQAFSLIVLPYNTALHLTVAQLGATLRRMRVVRGENGRLLIDVINPFLIAATPNDQMLTLENVLEDAENGETIVQMAANRLDDEAQTLHITWIYDRSPAGGGPVSRTVAQATYHYLFPHQWQMALREAGWQIRAQWGGYERTPFTEESERLLILAQ